MLEKYIEIIPEVAYQILEFAVKPTTIIYDKPIGIANNLVAKDNTLAIRIVHSGFAHNLIKKFGKPIVSTSANISGEPTPKSFNEISPQILKDVDYVVNLPCESNSNPSTIIKLSNTGEVKIIRE
jgi:L-threonylcarbamoyladenylate synthase